jgi:hypothetical protein
MEKLKLVLNKPAEAALKFAKARRGDSTIPGKGEWFMYSLCSGEVLFIDSDDCQDPDEMFAAAGIGARDPFTITLKKSTAGGRYLQVKRLGDAQEPAETPTRLESQLTASIKYQEQIKQAAFEAKLSADLAQLAQREPTTKPIPVASSAIATPNPIALVPERPRAGSLMASALVAAIDAVVIARDYGAAKGLTLEFFGEDVRAIAATLYIAHSKEPRYSNAAGGGR